ncbi:diguanylate cyclase [Zoogloea sp.]|uniref:sensor domain-containing diguanylate cyclase n=1 Tax=Zoogloea sp. TaxID=49181 RepID=UPI001416A107|nr:MAG: diguanylate cyclase [Zoogloea sp.]
MKLRLFSLSPVARVALGLVALLLSLLIALDLLFGLLPDRIEQVRQVRQQISESIAIQTAGLLQSGDLAALHGSLREVLQRQQDLRSIGIRQAQGQLLTQAGEHGLHWHPPADGSSTVDQVRVPVLSDGSAWGEVELAFRPVLPESITGWLFYPSVVALASVALASFGAFYLYLRRVLEYLDPSKAIPDRVRTAFDTLGEGVLILDKQGRVVLANKLFRQFHPNAGDEVIGRKVADLDWLIAGFQMRSATQPYPWVTAMEQRVQIQDEPLDIMRAGSDEPMRMLVGCAPILDGHKRLRGCLVTFSDVTALHRINTQLLVTLSDLEASKEEIRRQNEDLHRLATRDPMTGCLNRRAFFDSADPLFENIKGDGGELCCVMSDIDHFKSFNDRYGHTVGDMVIKSVAKCLGSELREVDLLCRYGGEEFCILLPGSTTEQARDVAERLRASVEGNAGSAIRDIPGIEIRSSFGVASIKMGAKDTAELIDQADNALYQSKQNGRNRVSIWAGERSVG